MPTPILATKLYIPPLRPNVVSRSRLVKRLNAGLNGKLTLISAPAGFGLPHTDGGQERGRRRVRSADFLTKYTEKE